jgi:hypothetical protein
MHKLFRLIDAMINPYSKNKHLLITKIYEMTENERIYLRTFPHNCPVNEKTADGLYVGRCLFHLKDGICSRHGILK